MKKNRNHPIIRIIRKELFRFLTDRKILASILLPGILIFCIYSLLGDALLSGFGGEERDEFRVAVIGESVTLNALADLHATQGATPTLEILTDEDDETLLRRRLTDGEIDLLVFVPSGFDALSGPSATVPELRVYYDSASVASSEAYAMLLSLLNAYESGLSNCFDVNLTPDTYDIADASALSATVYAMMMPMLLTMLLFAGCMTATPESIAGEKERGTIATLLITPMNRSHLAIGKVIGSSVTALLSGLSSFIGVMLSLPKLMGEEIAAGASYRVSDYLLILAVMLSLVLLFVSLISVLSTFASSVKEASTMLLPVMILVLGVGISGMFMPQAPSNLALYLIPIFGSVQSLSAIFSFAAQPMAILLVVVSNLAVTLGLIVLLAKMFSSERVMFRK